MLYQGNSKTRKLDLELRKTVPYEYIVERTLQDFYLPNKAHGVLALRVVLVLSSALVGSTRQLKRNDASAAQWISY